MKYIIYILVVFYLASVGAAAENDTNITVLNVAEGQSVILYSGDEALLIDTGHAGQVEQVLAFMKSEEISRLNSFLLTHLHPDHASGYFRIREAFPNAPVLSNCHPLPHDISSDMVRWLDEALEQDSLHQCIQAGSKMTFHNAEIAILWPEKISGSNLNHYSVVLNINLHGRNILLMGDADTQVEQQLLVRNRLPHTVDVLIVGHHGAMDATSEAFLQQIKPATAVISVNKANIRGYPSDDVIQRLTRHGAKVLRTDQHGDIEL